MRQIQNVTVLIVLLLISCVISKGQTFQLENLNRGVVAVAVPNEGIFISWRLLASDPDSVKPKKS